VLGLVALGLEVEIVAESVVAALADGRKHDAHVELSPALLVDAERRLLEDYAPLASMRSPSALCRAHTLLVLLE